MSSQKGCSHAITSSGSDIIVSPNNHTYKPSNSFHILTINICLTGSTGQFIWWPFITEFLVQKKWRAQIPSWCTLPKEYQLNYYTGQWWSSSCRSWTVKELTWCTWQLSSLSHRRLRWRPSQTLARRPTALWWRPSYSRRRCAVWPSPTSWRLPSTRSRTPHRPCPTGSCSDPSCHRRLEKMMITHKRTCVLALACKQTAH